MDRGYGTSGAYGGGGYRRSGYNGKKSFLQRMFRRNRAFLYWFPTMILFDELVFHIRIGGVGAGLAGVFLTLMFSLAAGCLLTLLSTFFINKINVYIVITLTALITILFEVQLIYTKQFTQMFRWATIGHAGEVTDFWREALARIGMEIVPFIILLLPLVFYCIWGRNLAPALGTPLRVKGMLLALTVMFHLTALAGIATNGNAGELYRGFFVPEQASGYFGLITETRLDIKYTLFGAPEGDTPDVVGPTVNPFGTEGPDTASRPSPGDTESPTGTGDPSDTEQVNPPTPITYGDNVLNIDWDTLIANTSDSDIKEMHQYFSSVTPTKQNQYTGLFEGKNLIQLTLEGFSSIVVEREPELYPLLYKMMHEGFYMPTYYNSLWGGSTATGEYVSMTGVFYNNADCLKMSADNYWPFALGNVFNGLDYTVYAFHNHFNTYYGRNLSHPNFGYENYIAIHREEDTPGASIGYKGDDWDVWPRSDLEMAKRTIDYYIDNAPFHAYYMTVSGHANYSFAGNSMASLHRSEVADLNYSDNVKAYFACQIEVELMLEYLVQRLDEKGILEDTVFVFNADHYPYALSESELSELYGLPEENIRNNLELYRNGAAIWCASMEEPVEITKPCSAMDIIPTVLNLFGINYDSRLFMGVDLNSGADPLVIINCDKTYWNWITPNGSYDTGTKKFTPAAGVTVDESVLGDYIKQMNGIVSTKRKYSLRILNEDYYKYVFPNGFSNY